jgi:hypothetical protein
MQKATVQLRVAVVEDAEAITLLINAAFRNAESFILDAAELYGVKAGCHFMDLRIVNVRLELPGFYRRRGYIETGTVPFIAGLNPKVPCHFVEMSKSLA